MRPLLLLSCLACSCGGRSLGSDAGQSRDAGDVTDGGSDATLDGGQDPGRCDHGVDDCPWEYPYCCVNFESTEMFCAADPSDFPTENCEVQWCWDCYERVTAESLQPWDCVDLSPFTEFHPERCPDGYPHCCLWNDEEVCADHLLVGWPCDE